MKFRYFRLRRFFLFAIVTGPAVRAMTGYHPRPPKSTDFDSDEPDRWSPAPTTPPRGKPVELLLKRDASVPSYLCGYINGSYASPLVCRDTARACLLDTYRNIKMCCLTTSGTLDCSYFTSCIPATSFTPLSTPCSGPCSSNNTLVRTCTDNGMPSCVELWFPEISYSDWACDSQTTPLTILMSAIDAPNSTTTSIHMISRNTNITSITGRTTSTTTSTTATSGVSSSTSLPPPATNSVSKSTPTGAIIGGVLGGIVLTGAFLTFMIWMVTRNSR